MAILTTQGDPTPMTFTEMSCNLSTGSASLPQEIPNIDFCFCDYECDFIEEVFAQVGATSYENDISSFLFDVPDTATGSFDLVLIQSDGTQINLTDNTYGIYYGLGTLSQSTKGGYRVEWEKVADLLGFGSYTFRLSETNYNNTVSTTSHCYKLLPYDPVLCDRTVKIQTVHNGCILGGFDYTGLDWLKSVRIPADFGDKTPRLETDNYINTQYKKKQIRDEVINEYTLSTERLPSYILNPLINDQLLANEVFITTYNLFSFEDLRDLEVYFTEVSEVNYAGNTSKKATYSMKFEEKTQNIIKRN